jgi:hypothetical protein
MSLHGRCARILQNLRTMPALVAESAADMDNSAIKLRLDR